MFLYLFVFSICLLFAHFAEKNKSNNLYWLNIGLSVLTISYFAGCRDIGIGIDTITYSQYYFDCSNYDSFSTFFRDLPHFMGDKGFLVLNYISHFFDNHVWVALFFIALWIYGFAFVAGGLFARKLNFDFRLFVFLYLFIFYNVTFNLMRQHCALSIIMLAYYFFYKKDYKWSSFLLVISYFFHTSIVAILPLPLIYYISEIRNNTLKNILPVFVVLILVISILYFYQFIELLSVNDVISSAYSDRYGVNSNYERRTSISPYQVIYMLIPPYFYILAHKKKVFKDNECRFNLLIHVMYVFFWLFSFISIYLFRLGFYYQMVQLFMLPYIFRFKSIQYSYKMLALLYIVAFWWFNSIFHGNHGTYPYTSKILGI